MIIQWNKARHVQKCKIQSFSSDNFFGSIKRVFIQHVASCYCTARHNFLRFKNNLLRHHEQWFTTSHTQNKQVKRQSSTRKRQISILNLLTLSFESLRRLEIISKENLMPSMDSSREGSSIKSESCHLQSC